MRLRFFGSFKGSARSTKMRIFLAENLLNYVVAPLIETLRLSARKSVVFYL